MPIQLLLLQFIISQQCHFCTCSPVVHLFTDEFEDTAMMFKPISVRVSDDDEQSIKLSDLLFFATGCKGVPPAGFTPTPSLQFLHHVEDFGQLSKFPKANTCECVLYLPTVHGCFEQFMEAMKYGIANGHGFGFA